MKNNSFIDSWFISKEVCKNLLNYFNKNKHLTKKGKALGNKVTKKSTDLSISPSSSDIEITEYLKELNKCLKKYKNKYSVLDFNLSHWGRVEYNTTKKIVHL
jgi:hypothetical protein